MIEKLKFEHRLVYLNPMIEAINALIDKENAREERMAKARKAKDKK